MNIIQKSAHSYLLLTIDTYSTELNIVYKLNIEKFIDRFTKKTGPKDNFMNILNKATLL